MSEAHQRKLDSAHDAIRGLHGDTSVSLEKTLESLEYLREGLDILIEAVREDIKMKGD